jgi:copper chaperone
MTTINTIKVKGMTCGGCAASITRAIRTADPGAKFEVDLKGHAVHVHGDRDEATIKSAIERAGYEVVG